MTEHAEAVQAAIERTEAELLRLRRALVAAGHCRCTCVPCTRDYYGGERGAYAKLEDRNRRRAEWLAVLIGKLKARHRVGWLDTAAMVTLRRIADSQRRTAAAAQLTGC